MVHMGMGESPSSLLEQPDRCFFRGHFRSVHADLLVMLTQKLIAIWHVGTLPHSWVTLVNLTVLDLSNNSLTGDSC